VYVPGRAPRDRGAVLENPDYHMLCERQSEAMA
jgi:hypothetical protein